MFANTVDIVLGLYLRGLPCLMLGLRGIDRDRGIFTCGAEAGEGAIGDGFHKLPDEPLTFPLGLVIWDLSPSLKGRMSGTV